MTKESIMLLKELIAEKDARLEAIGRRLQTLRTLVVNAEDSNELSMLSQEVKELGEEIAFLTNSRKAMQKEVNDFYRPAA